LFNNKFRLNLNVLINYITQNIQSVLMWLERRHGDACAAGQWLTLCSTPSHTSIRRCIKPSTSCTFIW